MYSDTSFPETLRRLVGKGFFNFPELLVALSREGVLRSFPPLQYMVQALPGSGFLQPLLVAETLAEVERMAVDFARLTGFREDCVAYLFASFAYAEGLLTAPPILPSLTVEGKRRDDDSAACEPQMNYGKGVLAAWDHRWSDEEKCRFLSGLIDVNRENERRIAMKVALPACVEAGEFNFRLTAELSRMEPGATGALFYAVYDREGRVADLGKLGVMCYDDVSPLPVSAIVPVAPRSVSRILLYWFDD